MLYIVFLSSKVYFVRLFRWHSVNLYKKNRKSSHDIHIYIDNNIYMYMYKINS